MCEKCTSEKLNPEVFDSRLRTYLQNLIARLPIQKRIKLKTFEKCGKKLVPIAGDNVILMKKGNNAKFFGVAACHNSFACPVCSANLMAKHSARIAAALGMLSERGKAAFMMTLTVKHFKAMKCLDALEILSNTWRQFATAVGRVFTHKGTGTVFAKFKKEFNITHWVKVIEFTYSKNGWNPHIHALFWVDKDRLQDVAKWEQKLQESWGRMQFNSWVKFWAGKHVYFGGAESEGKLRTVENLKKSFGLIDEKAKKNGRSLGLWISKDDDGTIRESKASDYICGWGADNELTGNYRKEASGKGSLTMHQLLESAANGNREHKRRYLEFILAIRERKRTRVRYAHGMTKELEEYMKEHDYEETVLKKNTEEKEEWKSIIIFSKKTWYQILALEEKRDLYIRHNILYLAAKYDEVKAFVLIYEYLRCYDIDIVGDNADLQAEVYNYYCDIAEQLYNGKARDAA